MADADDLDLDELDRLRESNGARLQALGARGVQVAPASMADLRIMSYLGVLLGEQLPFAELVFERTLDEQLTSSEAATDQMEAAQRAQQLTAGIGALPGNGKRA